jgi:branched-chain amino acid transport system substrate-binding protein
MNRIIAASLAAFAISTAAMAEPVKIGMITTLSGGGAGLGVDARDGFMLAIKNSGNKEIEVVTEDDAMKPELAVQIADKMIQSDKVDILTGIIWSNLAMAVVPNAVGAGEILPLGERRAVAPGGREVQPELFQRRLSERQFSRGDGRIRHPAGDEEDLHHGPQLSGGHRLAERLQALSTRASWPARFTPSSARPITQPK